MKKTKFYTPLFTFLLLSGLVVSLALGFTQSALAASPSPSPSPKSSPVPSPSASSDIDTTQRLKDRIDKVIEKRRDQVKGIIDQMSSEKRAFVAQVQRVTEKTVSLKTLKGEQEILTIDETVALVKDNKKITINDIAVDDWAIVMGYVNKDSFALKKIVVSSTSLLPRSYETVLGNVKTISTTQLVVTTKENQESKTYVLNKSTAYQDSNGNTSDRKSLRTDDQVLIISYTDKNSQIAHTIRLLAPR
jgi:hypothetical protein